MTTEIQWTDWIRHTPGQELLPGTYIRVEMVGRDRIPIIKEGMVDENCKGHPCWYATSPDDIGKMITRYKIRLDADLCEENADDKIREPSLPKLKFLEGSGP